MSISQKRQVRNSLENLPRIWAFMSGLLTSPLHRLFVMSDARRVLESALEQPFKDKVCP